jgi:hypothetical protein
LAGRWMATQARSLVSTLNAFAPDAVLTVPHNFYWLAAAAAASRMHKPLHLIYHDEWAGHITRKSPGWIGNLIRSECQKLVGNVYRQAASRLCISPGMEEFCRQQFGCMGSVLYPSRGEDSPTPYVRVNPHRTGPPRVAYGGALHHPGTNKMLIRLAAALETVGGSLDLYSPHTAAQVHDLGLHRHNIHLAGFFPAREMAERVSASADALFLPISFDSADRVDVSTLFPSKLADYTAVGLPIVVWSPPYSSAARWMNENQDAGALITTADPNPVKEAIIQMTESLTRSTAYAAGAVAAGNRYFDLAVAEKIFHASLLHCDKG